MRFVPGLIIACCLFLISPLRAQFITRNINEHSNVLSDIQMVNASVGYIGGVDGIFKTTNGGDTWTWLPYFVSTLPIGQQEKFTLMNEQFLAFLNENVGYAVGWNAQGNFEEIIKTTDGGATWQVQHYFNPDASPFQPLERRLRDIKAFDETHAIAVGYRGRILKTQNGTDWTVIPSGTTRNLETVTFYNNSVGLVAGDRELLLTTDGGETFQRHATEHSIRDAHYLSEQVIVATTAAGAIRSTDGGETWTSVMIGTDLHKISFINSTVGFIVGLGSILKTTDGGQHFESVTMYYSTFFPIRLTAIQALAERELYMTTDRGELYMLKNQDLPFKPESKFTADRTSTCDNSGTPINFTNEGRSDYQYQWLINNQLIAQTFNFSHVFTQAGKHKVSLVAYNGIAYDTAYQEFNILSKESFNNHFIHTALPDTIELVSQQNYDRFVIWNLQQNAYYQVFRNDVPISARIQAQYVESIRFIELQLPDVATGGTYTYKIVAELENQCGTTREEESFSLVVLDVPRRPINVTINHGQGSSLQLQWFDNSYQEEYYEIERKTEGASQFEVIGTAAGVYQLNFEDASPKVTHTTYQYRVSAVNTAGKSSYSNVVSAFIHGSIIYVNQNATGNNTGASWQHALKSLGRALDESTLDQEVWVAKGTYTSDGWITYSKGIYGGFAGTETELSQRNFHQNKTIMTGETGVPNDLTDNTEMIIRVTGLLDGFTIRGAKTTGVGLYNGHLQNCIVEENNNGVGVGGEGVTKMNKCIIRNNSTGISASGVLKIGNSFIYNNSYGISSTDDVLVAHTTLYANKEGYLKGSYPTNSEKEVEFVNSVIGYHPDNIQTDFYGQRVFHYNSVSWRNTLGTKYHMNYLAGVDNILGTIDDVLYFPEPQFQNGGVPDINPYYHGFLLELTDDFFDQNRVLDDTLDIGPAEFLADGITIPALHLKSISPEGKPTLTWQAVSGATKIWLERRRTYEVEFFAIDPAATEFTDETAQFLQQYDYSIRLQIGNRGTFPGNRVHVVLPAAIAEAEILTSSTCRVSYTYPYTFAAKNHTIMRYEGSLNNAERVVAGSIVGSQYSITDTNLKSNTTYYYVVSSYFQASSASYHVMPSNIVKIVTPANAKPAITGQQQASVFQYGQFSLQESHLTMQDDYNFPSGMQIEILPGDNYTVNNNIVIPNSDFSGTLSVNVRVSDMELKSDVFPFSLTVVGNNKPVIQSQQAARILEGTSYQLELSALTLSDDHNFPSGPVLQPGSGNDYKVAGMTITPNTNFSGELIVPVTVSDGVVSSDPFSFTLQVVKKIEGDFTANNSTIEEGSTIDFTSSFVGVPENIVWEFEGAIPSSSSDANPNQILYPTAGTFKVQLTLQDDLQNVVILKEDFVTVDFITAVEEELPAGITVFPNPSNRKFSLTSKSPLPDFSITILDYTGKEIKNMLVLDKILAVFELPPGQYMLAIRTANRTYYKKLVSY